MLQKHGSGHYYRAVVIIYSIVCSTSVRLESITFPIFPYHIFYPLCFRNPNTIAKSGTSLVRKHKKKKNDIQNPLTKFSKTIGKTQRSPTPTHPPRPGPFEASESFRGVRLRGDAGTVEVPLEDFHWEVKRMQELYSTSPRFLERLEAGRSSFLRRKRGENYISLLSCLNCWFYQKKETCPKMILS